MNKKKLFLFVYLAAAPGYTNAGFGIAYLAPIIRKRSYDVETLSITYDMDEAEFKDKILKLNPSIIGFSATSPQFRYLKKYSSVAGQFKEILQICGGALPTLDPYTVLRETQVNGVVVGEGEKPVDQLLCNIENSKDILDTEGFYWNVNGTVKTNPIPPFIPDISQLDFPDLSIFEDWMVCNCNNELEVMLSRGCPYECNYCSNKALKNTYPSANGYFRTPSVEYALELLERLLYKHSKNAKNIAFVDDLLIANKKWFADFANEYNKRIKLPYRLNVKPECVTKEIAEILKESGCYLTMIGLESGNEQLRKNLLNRKYSNDLFYEKCKIIKDAGLLLFTFNIVGWPFETKGNMEETLEMNKKIEADTGVCAFFYPFRGTELYKLCERENLLVEEYAKTNYNTDPNIRLTNVSEHECNEMQQKIQSFLTSGKSTDGFNFSHECLCV